jgi:hypothetical protein
MSVFAMLRTCRRESHGSSIRKSVKRRSPSTVLSPANHVGASLRVAFISTFRKFSKRRNALHKRTFAARPCNPSLSRFENHQSVKTSAAKAALMGSDGGL